MDDNNSFKNIFEKKKKEAAENKKPLLDDDITDNEIEFDEYDEIQSEAKLIGDDDYSDYQEHHPDTNDKKPKKKKSIIARLFLYFLTFSFVVGLCLGVFLFFYLLNINRNLPEYMHLKNYAPPVTTRFYAGDGSLVAEYANESRIFVPFDDIPEQVIQAFLSSEDKYFFLHNGIYFKGIPRAFYNSIKAYRQGKPLQGASTITQQVAKNFLLSSEQTYKRKIKEAFLALKLEKALSKEKILELYLNEIYMGNRSYGIAAASLNYFNKPLIELEPHEIAYLAALPKGPANYHPIKYNKKAKIRRNYILERMYLNGFIDNETKEYYQAKDLDAKLASPLGAKSAYLGYFSEEVRKNITDEYGNDALYKGGLAVRTTIDPILQEYAVDSLRYGLIGYDIRHGYRGALENIEIKGDLASILSKKRREYINNYKYPYDVPGWGLAIIKNIKSDKAEIIMDDGSEGEIPFFAASWAKKYISSNEQGKKPTNIAQILQKGDIVFACKNMQYSGNKKLSEKQFSLCQIPEINGSIIALNPHNGRIQAMFGGFSFGISRFNRATQAWRQPGSLFKSFVYASALDNGYTPSSKILDAPFVATRVGGWWKPGNYVKESYSGMTTLRRGLEFSRNTMTVRLTNDLGINYVINYAKRFDISPNLPQELAISLGVEETSLLNITNAYATFVNGGKKIKPFMVDKIQDRYGKIIFSSSSQYCQYCNLLNDFELNQDETATGNDTELANIDENNDEFIIPSESKLPNLTEYREQILNPLTAYQITNILQGVVKYGSGKIVRKMVSNPLAGKTGTTNDFKDAWFVGYSPDLIVGVFVGFDTPTSLGYGESGGSVAAPIFGQFMKNALKDQSPTPFRRPEGIILTYVDHKSGTQTFSNTGRILEAFKPNDKIPQNTTNKDEISVKTNENVFWDDFGFEENNDFDENNNFEESEEKDLSEIDRLGLEINVQRDR